MSLNLESNPKSDKKEGSVETLIKRVNIAFLTFIIIGLFIIGFFIYLPFNSALKNSLIDNFKQLSMVNYESLQSSIGRGLEGARSLSSRTMIKDSIIEYMNEEITMDELISYTQPKYEDGASVLEYLIRAERYMDNQSIAKYTPKGNNAGNCFEYLNFEDSMDIDSRLCLSDGGVFLIVFSPIFNVTDVVGYDKLIFDLSEQVLMLSNEITKTIFLENLKFQNLLSQSQIVADDDETLVFRKDGFYYHTVCMQNNIHLISMQNEKSLFSVISKLSIQLFLVIISVLLIIIVLIYFYIIRFAKNELIDLENTKVILKKEALKANKDPLTKISNRKYGMEFINNSFVEYKLTGSHYTVIMFDIDSFKHINDTFGHNIGDEVLIEVANTVKNNIRNKDNLFRWGGDEFICVFKGLNDENAIASANKIFDVVAALTIDTGVEKISPIISIGISSFTDEDSDYSDAVNRADKAMYKSKASEDEKVHIL